MDKHASIWNGKQIYLHMCVCYLSVFPQEAVSSVISVSLCENGNLILY